MPSSCALLRGFAIGARVALLWQHYGNARQSPAVIRPAHCTPHAQRMPAMTPLAGDNIDARAACAVPFRPYCGGVVTRTRNVSNCMLVLALCLVMAVLCNTAHHYIFALWFLSSFFFLSFFRLISAIGDWMSTILPHILTLLLTLCGLASRDSTRRPRLSGLVHEIAHPNTSNYGRPMK